MSRSATSRAPAGFAALLALLGQFLLLAAGVADAGRPAASQPGALAAVAAFETPGESGPSPSGHDHRDCNVCRALASAALPGSSASPAPRAVDSLVPPLPPGAVGGSDGPLPPFHPRAPPALRG